MSDLLPFDVEEFKKDPMRLRHGDGTKVVEAHIFANGRLCVIWASCADSMSSYVPHEHKWLRLAPKTRTIWVRLYRNRFYVIAMTSDYSDLTKPNIDWIGEAFKREIPD